MIRNLICISCPLGCSLKVDVENKTVCGNNCKRGEVYGINEVTNPVRIITTTIKIIGSYLPVLPVKTDLPINKDLNYKVMNILNTITVHAPIKCGDIILENILGTGANIIATKTLLEDK